MNVLLVGDNDVLCASFGGHNLHSYLRDAGLEANHLVVDKLSNDVFTYIFTQEHSNIAVELLKSKLFLEADIVHIHLIHNTTFDINYLPLLASLKPVVITLHDPFFLGGHCIHHFDCNKWQSQCFDCEYLEVPFCIKQDDTALSFLQKKLAIGNSNICAIVASHWMYERASLSPIWKNKTIFHLPFGVDQQVFCPKDKLEAKKKLGISPDSFVIMVRTQNTLFKGLDLVKEALGVLSAQKKITLITVAEKGLLAEFATQYTVLDFGWVCEQAKLAELYQACDVLLMPSRQEAFGMMAIEAMSCATCVLALDAEGSALKTVINAPECGIAASRDDLAKILQGLVDAPALCQQYGIKALKYAKTHYEKDNYVKNMIEIYTKIVMQHTPDINANVVIAQIAKHCAEPPTLTIPKKTLKKRLRNFLHKFGI